MLSLLQTHCQIFYPLFIKVALRYISTLPVFSTLLQNLINCCPLTYFSLCFRCFAWCGWEIYLSVGPTSLARATSARRGFSFVGRDTACASSRSRYGALLWPTEKKTVWSQTPFESPRGHLIRFSFHGIFQFDSDPATRKILPNDVIALGRPVCLKEKLFSNKCPYQEGLPGYVFHLIPALSYYLLKKSE